MTPHCWSGSMPTRSIRQPWGTNNPNRMAPTLRPRPSTPPIASTSTDRTLAVAGRRPRRPSDRWIPSPHADVGHRLRLPRRRARGRRWPSSGTTSSASTSTGRRSRRWPPAAHAVLRARLEELLERSRWPRAGCGSRTDFADVARAGAHGALPLRGDPAEARASTPPTCATSRRRRESLLAVLRARRPGGRASRPCRWARRRGSPTLVAGKVARRAAGLEPGVPPRGLRGPGHPAPRPAGLRAARRRRRRRRRAALLDEVVRADRRARHAAGGHRLRDRGDGEDRGQLVPRHEDLVHQRDGRAVRGHRRRREAAGRRDRLRRPDRPQVPQRRARLRRRLPAQGHPRVHGPGRRAGRRPGADVPARGRQHQHAPPDPDGRAGARGLRRLAAGQAGRRAGGGVQAGQRRHPRLPGAQRRRAAAAAGRGRAGDRPGGDRERRAGCGRSCDYADDRRGGGASAPTPCSCSPSGSSTARSTRSPSAKVVAQKRVLDGRNALDRDALAGRRLDLPRAGPPRA